MIPDLDTGQPELFAPEDFETPFGGGLDPDNRWVKWAGQIPWQALAASYHATLKPGGRRAKPARLVLGALIIKHQLGLSDTETLEQLRENPYLQYFCGLKRYQQERAFAPTLFVKLRERLTADRFAVFEQAIIDRAEHCRRRARVAPSRPGDDTLDTPSTAGASPTGGQAPDASMTNAGGHASAASPSADTDSAETPEPAPSDEESDATHRGQLIVDASVAEQGIRYPTDASLLNEARESAEALIDTLWDHIQRHDPTLGLKPRTYRQRARTQYLGYSKRRRPTARHRRTARRQQLQYIKRDLGHIDALLDRWQAAQLQGGFPLSSRQQQRLWVIRELTRQQAHLHRTRARRIDHRLVSLHQPHVRPVVRGRLGHPVEFGAKFSVALVDGIACVDSLRWDAFSEAGDLMAQCQAYRRRYGVWPEKILADGAYGTHANRRWLKQHGIAFGGKPLGRPPKLTADQRKALSRQRRADACNRIPIEGKFGQGKAAYGLARIAARRADTSQAWIRSIFLVMNLIALQRILLFGLFDSRPCVDQNRARMHLAAVMWLCAATYCPITVFE